MFPGNLKMNISRITYCVLVCFLLSSGNCIAGSVSIRILHVNDFHGFAEPYRTHGSVEPRGGAACLAAEAGTLRREKPSLLLAAGDMISGNTWANLFQGQPVIELMNLMGFDAMTVGNHEFDYGTDVLKQRVSEARFPVLGANVNGLGLLKPYYIRELAGVRIAVLGVVTEDTPVTTHPKNVRGLKFEPVAETVKKYLPELKRQADFIIVLTHIGFAADRLLAEQVPGIDVIVGGHSHTRIDRPVAVGKTIIVQAWEHGKALGVLDLTVEDGKITEHDGRLVDISPDMCRPDIAVKALVEKYRKKVDAELDAPAGRTDVDLDGENVRKRETNLGDLIADIVRLTARADAALLNSGGIRTGIRKGVIRVGDIYSVLPYDGYVVAISLTGKQIIEALEHGVSAVGSGAFPQVSGISFSYDGKSPPGKRIREAVIGGKQIDPAKEYIIATNDFIAAGGDGYKVFARAAGSAAGCNVTGGAMKGGNLVYSDASRQLRDIVVGYLKERKVVAPEVEGRITEVR